MKLLFTGASGQLCKAFITYCQRAGVVHDAPPETQLDITNPDQLSSVLDAAGADVLVNTAAYNQVDKAEADPTIAHRVNADAVGQMAAECQRRKMRFVHFSSDYVFDGTARRPYVETDPPHPLNVYGQSKLAGEQAALAQAPDALILRLSWVFGHGQQNFFHKLEEWSRKRDTLDIVWDQLSTPTYTEDIVMITMKALEQGLQGIWHAPNSGYASRYETARSYLELRGRTNLVIPVSSSQFPTPAQRPFFSVLSNVALAKALQYEIPTWQDALGRYCRSIPPPGE